MHTHEQQLLAQDTRGAPHPVPKFWNRVSWLTLCPASPGPSVSGASIPRRPGGRTDSRAGTLETRPLPSGGMEHTSQAMQSLGVPAPAPDSTVPAAPLGLGPEGPGGPGGPGVLSSQRQCLGLPGAQGLVTAGISRGSDLQHASSLSLPSAPCPQVRAGGRGPEGRLDLGTDSGATAPSESPHEPRGPALAPGPTARRAARGPGVGPSSSSPGTRRPSGRAGPPPSPPMDSKVERRRLPGPGPLPADARAVAHPVGSGDASLLPAPLGRVSSSPGGPGPGPGWGTRRLSPAGRQGGPPAGAARGGVPACPPGHSWLCGRAPASPVPPPLRPPGPPLTAALPESGRGAAGAHSGSTGDSGVCRGGGASALRQPPTPTGSDLHPPEGSGCTIYAEGVSQAQSPALTFHPPSGAWGRLPAPAAGAPSSQAHSLSGPFLGGPGPSGRVL